MTFSKALYFSALIPPQEVKDDIFKLKLEIKEKYNAAHALKLPAHITITPPVWLENNLEQSFLLKLKSIAEAQSPFRIELSDFGHFGQRVIFVKVVNHEPVNRLYANASKGLKSFLPESSTSSIHPHITLATRDLSREIFQKTWKEFQSRTYNQTFISNSLFLFKHNGKTWDVIEEFFFRKNEITEK